MDDSTTNNTNEIKIFFIERDISCQNKTTSSNYSNLFSKSISSYEFIKKDLESLLNGFNFTIKINKENLNDDIDFFKIENLLNDKEFESINTYLEKNKNKEFKEEYENLIKNFKELNEFIRKIKEKLKEENEFELKMTFERGEEKSNGKYINFTCKYNINSVEMNINSYKDKDVLNKEGQENFDKLLSQLNPLEDISLSTINKEEYSTNIQVTIHFILNIFEAKKYKILGFVENIGKHKEYGQFIIELSNGTFISSGKNSLYFYDKNYKKKNELKLENNYICELGNNNDGIKLAICSNNGIYEVLLKNDVKIGTVFNIENDKNYRFCLNLKKTTIICTENGIFNIENLFDKIFLENKYKLNDKNYWGGIKVNQNIVAFTSNEILPNGNDEIIIYNINSKNNIDIIKGCSFILSQDNLAIMSRKKTNNKILLCACKKYKKSQKNGILLLKLEIDNIVKISKRFYDTGNFEVYCFCPIIIREKSNNNIILNKKEYKVEDTKYFFVGGLDRNKKKGLIKLYQVKYKKPFKYTKIEYIQNIKPKKCIIDDSKHFNGFKGPITCIKQSLKQETILVTCLDGSVFLLTIPNIIGLKELNKNFNNLKNKK